MAGDSLFLPPCFPDDKLSAFLEDGLGIDKFRAVRKLDLYISGDRETVPIRERPETPSPTSKDDTSLER